MECLEKDPECRPVMAEMIEHPFLTQLPENDYHVGVGVFRNVSVLKCLIYDS